MGIIDWAKKKLKDLAGLIASLPGKAVNAVKQVAAPVAQPVLNAARAVAPVGQAMLGAGSPLGASNVLSGLVGRAYQNATTDNRTPQEQQVATNQAWQDYKARGGQPPPQSGLSKFGQDVLFSIARPKIAVSGGTAPGETQRLIQQGQQQGAIANNDFLHGALAPSVEAGINLAPVGRFAKGAMSGASLGKQILQGVATTAPLGVPSGATRAYAIGQDYTPLQAAIDTGGFAAGGVAGPVIGRGVGKVISSSRGILRPGSRVTETPVSQPIKITQVGDLPSGISGDQARAARDTIRSQGSVTIQPTSIDTELTPSVSAQVISRATKLKPNSSTQRQAGIKIISGKTKINEEPLPADKLGDYNPNTDKIRVRDISPSGNSTLVHEVAHKQYESLPYEKQAALDRTLKELNFRNNGFFLSDNRGKDPTEAIAQGVEELVKTRRKYPQAVNSEINKIEGGRDLIRFVKQVEKDSANVEKVGYVPKSQSNSLNTSGQIENIKELAPNYTGNSGGGKRIRNFPETIKNADTTAPEIKQSLASQQYEVLPNKKVMDNALTEINENPQAVLNDVLSSKRRNPGLNAKGLILAEHAQQQGDFDLAQKIFKSMAPGNTKEGQTIQILSIWGKTTPEGVVRYAQKVTDDANNVLALKGKNPKLTLSPDKAERFRAMSEEIQSMPEGREKLIATQKMLNEVHDIVPATINQKLQSSLYYAQLLNPKTAIRNILGNVGFAATENVKDVVGAPLDLTVTGLRRLFGQDATRTTYVPNPFRQIESGIKEGGKALQEAKAGVNLSGLEGQLQIGNKPRAFRGKVGTFLDKTLQTELSGPDRFFFGAREQQTLRNLMRGAKVDKPTPEMLEIARADGMYATFQDDSNAAKLFVNLKKALNVNKDFGMGSFVLNYPKTPGNLLARGIDYSPVGFIKATMNIAKPLFGGQFNQKAFVDNLSRALVGTTALVGTGALLHRVGIITGAPDENKSLNALQRATGLGAYRINVSALKRFVLSGFDPEEAKLREEDSLMSYDWFQPAAIGIAMGANIDENKGLNKGTVGAITNAIAEGTNTLADQPLVSGVQRLFGYGDPGKGALEVAVSGPAAFIPTLLNQINQLTDNTPRETYDPDPYKRAENLIKAKIPGLGKGLPERVTPFGDPAERYQGGTNNPLNVFLNPAFLSKYQPKPYEKAILETAAQTGDKSIAPTLSEKKMTIDGKEVKLTGQEMVNFQRVTGENYKDAIQSMIARPSYQAASPVLRARAFTNAEKDGRAVGKLEFSIQNPNYTQAQFERDYSDLTTTQRKLYNGKFPDYILEADENRQKDEFNKTNEPIINPQLQGVYDEYLSLPAKSQARRDYLASHSILQQYFDNKDKYLIAYKDKFGELPFGAKEPFKKYGGYGKGYRRGGKGGGIRIASPKLKTTVASSKLRTKKPKKAKTIKAYASKKAKKNIAIRPKKPTYRSASIKIRKGA